MYRIAFLNRAIWLFFVTAGICCQVSALDWSEFHGQQGVLRTRIEDYSDGHSESATVVDFGTRIYTLAAISSDLPNDGATVAVWGTAQGDILTVQRIETVISPQMKIAPSGSVSAFGLRDNKALAMLVNWNGDTSRPWNVEQLRTFMYTDVDGWMEEVSYGKFGIEGDVVDWINLNVSDVCKLDDVAVAVQNYFNQHGLPLNYNHVAVFSPSKCPGLSGAAYRNNKWSYYPGSMALRNVSHELGHNLGLIHANALKCDGVSPITAPVNPTCVSVEYKDDFDAMGDHAAYHYNALYKKQLGWVSDAEIKVVSLSGVYRVSALEAGGSVTKALKISTVIDGDPVDYTVEYRTTGGDATGRTGIVLRASSLDATKKPNTFLLDMAPATLSTADGALQQGQTFVDPGAGIKITPVSVVPGSHADVKVEYPANSGATWISVETPRLKNEEDLSTIVRVVRTGYLGARTDVPFETFEKISSPSLETVATAGSDYEPKNGLLTFQPGEAVKEISVVLIDDSIDEAIEIFGFRLLPVTDGSATILTASVNVAVGDNDFGTATLALTSLDFSTEENAGVVGIGVKRIGSVSGAVSAPYTTAAGTALGNVDFTLVSGTVTFQDGEIEPKYITIPILNDAIHEPDEYFSISLGVGQPPAKVTIVDDDVAEPGPSGRVLLMLSPAEPVSEADGKVNIYVDRVEGSSGLLEATITTVNGTAVAGVDFTALSMPVRFVDGDTSRKTIQVSLLNDSVYESTESFFVQTLETQASTIQVTVIDDDRKPGQVRLSAEQTAMSEKDPFVQVKVERIDGADGPISVDFETVDGTARGGLDFTPVVETVHFADAESVSKVISIPLISDAAPEPQEYFEVRLKEASGGAMIADAGILRIVISADVVSPGQGETPGNPAPVYETNTMIRPGRPYSLVPFDIAESDEVTIRIYTLQNDLIKEIRHGERSGGRLWIRWDGTNDQNERVASGVYILSSRGKIIKKVIVIR